MAPDFERRPHQIDGLVRQHQMREPLPYLGALDRPSSPSSVGAACARTPCARPAPVPHSRCARGRAARSGCRGPSGELIASRPQQRLNDANVLVETLLASAVTASSTTPASGRRILSASSFPVSTLPAPISLSANFSSDSSSIPVSATFAGRPGTMTCSGTADRGSLAPAAGVAPGGRIVVSTSSATAMDASIRTWSPLLCRTVSVASCFPSPLDARTWSFTSFGRATPSLHS